MDFSWRELIDNYTGSEDQLKAKKNILDKSAQRIINDMCNDSNGMPNPSQCPSLGVLANVFGGILDETERLLIFDHIDKCVTCQGLLVWLLVEDE